ncbi:MAG TPA: hypothetical protein P5280_00310 [Cyclobacteriaceae bacterium]|nr:hypothetical protein [Cyclobacteriaceae bacterium]
MIKSKYLYSANLAKSLDKTTKQDRRFSVVLFFMLAWVYLQIIAVLEPLPAPYLSVALQLKNASGIVVAVVGTILYFQYIRLNKFAFFPLVFSIFTLTSYLLGSLRYSYVSLADLYLILMYFLWSWVIFVLSPVIFDSYKKVKMFLKWAILGTGLIFVSGWGWSVFAGVEVTQVFGGSRAGAERYSFGFRNVGYIGSVLVSLASGATFLYALATHNRTRFSWSIVAILSLVVMLMTDSRSYMVFIAVVWFVYLILNSRYSMLIMYISGFGLIALFLWVDKTFLQAVNPFQQINFYSSGRLLIWQTSIQRTMESITTILVGLGSSPGWRTTFFTLSGEEIIKPFQRFAADNVFVEMFSLYGLIGLTLFLLSIFRVINAGVSLVRDDEQNSLTKSALSVAVGVVVAMLVSGVTSSTMPSMGNLLNAILLFVAVPIIVNSAEEGPLQHQNK